MSHKSHIATEELARLLGALSHRHRVLLIEELRRGERDVGTLRDVLDISTSRVSQHLRVLRSHHIVRERREGRHVYYHLVEPEIAAWLAEGLKFVETEIDDTSEIHAAIEHTRHIWLDEDGADADS